MITRRSVLAGLMLVAGGGVYAQPTRPVRLLVARQRARGPASNCTAPCIRGSVYDVSNVGGTIVPAAIVASGRSPICDVVERPWRNNAPHVSSIPRGIYQARVRTDATKDWMIETPSRAWRIELANVPGGRSAIQFHYGEDERWSEGCLIVGRHRANSTTAGGFCQLQNADQALAALRQAVEAPGGDSARIEITVGDVSDLFVGAPTTC